MLRTLGIKPDFELATPGADIRFVHRRLADGDIFCVDNHASRPETVTTIFRVAGKEAELWHADSGKSEPASYDIAEDRTAVPLALGPHETVFVVFREPAHAPQRTVAAASETSLDCLAPCESIRSRRNRREEQSDIQAIRQI